MVVFDNIGSQSHTRLVRERQSSKGCPSQPLIPQYPIPFLSTWLRKLDCSAPSFLRGLEIFLGGPRDEVLPAAKYQDAIFILNGISWTEMENVCLLSRYRVHLKPQIRFSEAYGNGCSLCRNQLASSQKQLFAL